MKDMTKQTLGNLAECGLTREDLAPLGYLSMNDLPMMVETEGDHVRLVPNRNFNRHTSIAAVIIGVFFVGFWVLLKYLMGADFHWVQQASVLGIGALTVVAFVTVGIWRHRYLLERSPLLDWNRASGEVSILACRRTFPLADVVALVAFSSWHSSEGPSSELQLVTEREGIRERHLILTFISGSAWAAFGKVLKVLAAKSDLPIFITEAQGSANLKPEFIRL